MSPTPPRYRIARAQVPPSLQAEVGSIPWGWANAHVAQVTHWHAKSGAHRPTTYARALYDDAHLYLRFDVMDRYVQVRHTLPQEPVWQDSCVEFFVQPAGQPTYFNFEINAGGNMLLYAIENPARTKDGFAQYQKVASHWLERVHIGHSLPKRIESTVMEPIAWSIAYRIPFALFEAYIGPFSVEEGTVWRGNLFKCGGDPAHAHWGSWADIGAALNFHQPERFGELVFG